MATDSGDDIKTTILEHARALLAESGVDGFSVREVARRAGIRVSTLQYHYKSRDQLVEACLDEIYGWLSQLGERLKDESMANLDHPTTIAWAVREGYRFARRNRPVVRLMEKSITDTGGLNARRRAQMRSSLMTGLANWLAPQSTHSQNELMLRVQSVIMLIGQYAILDDDNLLDISEATAIDDAEQVVADHLVGVATNLVCSG
ncbi:MAG: TetR/AcrR family transcriptional regulator [Deltaproteobacteria bacterium]|nr:TetR/AcrR family transcriptional regulator [Deltaproteobacteria bacterium]